MAGTAKAKRSRGRTAPAGRGRKRRHWLRTVLFFLLFPFAVWFIAFLLWFNWRGISALFTQTGDLPNAAIEREHKTGQRQPLDSSSRKANDSRENILDEDRQKLDDILKQRR